MNRLGKSLRSRYQMQSSVSNCSTLAVCVIILAIIPFQNFLVLAQQHENVTTSTVEDSGEQQGVENASTPILIIPDCAVMDLVFVIDSSGSIHDIYGRQMQLVKDLVMLLPVGQYSTNVAAIQYAGYPWPDFSLHTYNNRADILHHVSQMYFRSGVTRTGSALLQAERELFNTGRTKAAKSIILITDGVSWDDPLPIANRLRQKGVDIFVASVSNHPFKYELLSIAGSPLRLFLFDNVNNLKTTMYDKVLDLSKNCEKNRSIPDGQEFIGNLNQTNTTEASTVTVTIAQENMNDSLDWEIINATFVHPKNISDGENETIVLIEHLLNATDVIGLESNVTQVNGTANQTLVEIVVGASAQITNSTTITGSVSARSTATSIVSSTAVTVNTSTETGTSASTISPTSSISTLSTTASTRTPAASTAGAIAIAGPAAASTAVTPSLSSQISSTAQSNISTGVAAATSTITNETFASTLSSSSPTATSVTAPISTKSSSSTSSATNATSSNMTATSAATTAPTTISTLAEAANSSNFITTLAATAASHATTSGITTTPTPAVAAATWIVLTSNSTFPTITANSSIVSTVAPNSTIQVPTTVIPPTTVANVATTNSKSTVTTPTSSLASTTPTKKHETNDVNQLQPHLQGLKALASLVIAKPTTAANTSNSSEAADLRENATTKSTRPKVQLITAAYIPDELETTVLIPSESPTNVSHVAENALFRNESLLAVKNSSAELSTILEKLDQHPNQYPWGFKKPNCKLDVLFVVDSSSTNHTENELQKDFISDLIQQLKLGEDYQRVAFVQFSGSVWQRTEFTFERYNNHHDVMEALNSLYESRGSTNIGQALKHAESVLNQSIQRPKSDTWIILISDGYTRNDALNLKVANRLRSRPTVSMFAVSLNGIIDRSYFNALTGRFDHVFVQEEHANLKKLLQRRVQNCSAGT